MNSVELAEVVAGGESKTLEFKKSTSRGALRGATETLCAFLNAAGGTVLFGVRDDGKIVGQEVSDGTLRTVWEAIAEIDPAVSPDVHCVTIEGSMVVSVSVAQGLHRPYRVRGRAFKRVAASTVAMDEVEAQRVTVEAAHGATRWETEGLPSLDTEALDHDEIRRTVREGVTRGRITEPELTDPLSLLRGFGLVRSDRPVRAAAVLFGTKDYLQAHLPQCRVRLARFPRFATRGRIAGPNRSDAWSGRSSTDGPDRSRAPSQPRSRRESWTRARCSMVSCGGGSRLAHVTDGSG